MSTAGLRPDQVKSTVEEYRELHETSTDVSERLSKYTTLVNQYYDLANDFYEFGWGKSFHFAPRAKGETFNESIVRHEQFLARKLRLRRGMKALDVGCGVGGPMRNIASFSGASVVGVNNNADQIERGTKYNDKAKLSGQCSFLKTDFMNLPLEDNSFDAIYTIEASCHAPDRVGLFKELLRVLKPGQFFGGYEWCLTHDYEPENPDHQKIKRDIEEGNGLPDIIYTWDIDAALREAGFELVENVDLAQAGDPDLPWFAPLAGSDGTLRSLPRTPMGREITNRATKIMEKLKIAPEGTSQVSEFLNVGADALVAGGELEVFTPMYFFLARKPA